MQLIAYDYKYNEFLTSFTMRYVKHRFLTIFIDFHSWKFVVNLFMSVFLCETSGKCMNLSRCITDMQVKSQFMNRRITISHSIYKKEHFVYKIHRFWVTCSVPLLPKTDQIALNGLEAKRWEIRDRFLLDSLIIQSCELKCLTFHLFFSF